jgi:hypothetical protein
MVKLYDGWFQCQLSMTQGPRLNGGKLSLGWLFFYEMLSGLVLLYSRTVTVPVCAYSLYSTVEPLLFPCARTVPVCAYCSRVRVLFPCARTVPVCAYYSSVRVFFVLYSRTFTVPPVCIHVYLLFFK